MYSMHPSLLEKYTLPCLFTLSVVMWVVDIHPSFHPSTNSIPGMPVGPLSCSLAVIPYTQECNNNPPIIHMSFQTCMVFLWETQKEMSRKKLKKKKTFACLYNRGGFLWRLLSSTKCIFKKGTIKVIYIDHS